MGPKLNPFLIASRRLLGTILEAFLALLKLSWEAWWLITTVKNNTKHTCAETNGFAMSPLLKRF
jgi:hypothetical protein